MVLINFNWREDVASLHQRCIMLRMTALQLNDILHVLNLLRIPLLRLSLLRNYLSNLAITAKKSSLLHNFLLVLLNITILVVVASLISILLVD